MPPNASAPTDLKLLLNSARRQALSNLIEEILKHMRSKVEQSFEASPQAEIAQVFAGNPNSRDRQPSQSGQQDAEERRRRLEARLDRSFSTPKLRKLEQHALLYFDTWAKEVLKKFRTTCGGPEFPRSEQRRRDWMAQRDLPPPPYTPTSAAGGKDQEAAAMAEQRETDDAKAVSLLQSQFPPISTRLSSLPKEDRLCIVSCMVLLLLSLGHYSAHSRVLLCYLTSSLALPLNCLATEETEIARTLMLASKTLSADAETKKRKAQNATSRRWKVGLASVAGAAVIGITGGLAAPIVAGAIGGIMGGVGLGGVASFLGIFAMNGALVGTLFGAFGAKMTGKMIDNYAKEVSDFKFLPIAEELGAFSTREQAEFEGRRLRVTIGINGWLSDSEDVVKPWLILGHETEAFALRYEMDALIDLGTSLQNMVSSYAWSFVKVEILKRTVLATLWSALWPISLVKMATSVDNPFSVARNRSEKAGEVLADALINKAQGERPVTLIGYSLGARVIYSCLKSLAERKAFGLVETVVLIGAPVPSNNLNWRVMRSVVSGKITNVYSVNDYILAFLYRATSIQYGVAGLQEIGDVNGIDNLDLSKEVSGHLRYPELIGKILKRSGFTGVLVKDTDIEADVTDVQLIVADSGEAFDDVKAAGDARNLSEADLWGLIDEQEPTASALQTNARTVVGLDHHADKDHEVDELLRGIAGMGIGSQDKPIRTMSAPAGITRDIELSSLTSAMASTSIQDLSSHSHLVQDRELQSKKLYDSESKDGGITMVDNDFLDEVPAGPISDSDDDDDELPPPHETDPRISEKVAAFQEQKSLGSIYDVGRGVPRGEASNAGQARGSM